MTSVEAMSDPVSWSIEDGVVVVRVDDGKANAIAHPVIEGLHRALDAAEAEGRAVVLVGREGRFSAGYDLGEMTAGADRARALVRAGGELLVRVFVHPQPVVVAATGHALAAGALLLLACDIRVGAEGPFKIGLNETAIGLGLPAYAIELAQARLDPRHVTRSALCAEIHDPVGAVAAGFLDRVVPADACAQDAVAEARRLGELRSGAYRHTKELLRRPVVERVLAGIEADMATIAAPEA
jgi:enoyl-CoA hydratase